MSDKDPYFFGYGSLVNIATHSYLSPERARLKGWRRGWRHSANRDVTLLTAIRDPGSEIDGLIARVPGGDWAALDAREHGYDRLPASEDVDHPVAADLHIAVYAVPDHRPSAPADRPPILLSYIDVVIQGFLQQYGETGASDFFATTDGWDTPILNDRDQPIYPRHQSLSVEERRFVDRQLSRLDVDIRDSTDGPLPFR